ncbi:MAG: tRNA lysidine(34) synthetase TilS [Roseburia sp.]|nr:tRNA lysidine(34) synthetase TilS [Roseburia sp.]
MDILEEKTAVALSPYRGKKLAVGVSGGRDSMCLISAVVGCGFPRGDIVVVHVNHGLREQADSDESFVREYCAQRSLEFRAFRVDVKRECAAKGLSVEQAARDLRYGVFFDLIKSRAADVILTAHHALDNAESVLMHMFRGSGIDGLRAMSAPRAVSSEAGDRRGGLPLIRPFLDVYPEEIEGYAARNDIKYVTDETNGIDDADRNYLRLNVIPLIERRYRGAVRAINELSRECADVCEFMDGALKQEYISIDGGVVTVADAAFASPLAHRYVRAALKFFTLTDISRAQTDRVVALCGSRTGAEVELSGGIVAAREYGCVALYLPRLPYMGEKPLVFGANFIDGLAFDVTENADDPKAIRGCAVDGDALRGATVRFRRDGDVITPCGGKTKKLKQFFIDKKIPKRLRDRIPLVCKGSTVLVAVGVEVSEQAKRTQATTFCAAVVPRR